MIEPVNDKVFSQAIRHSIDMERLKTAEVHELVGFFNKEVEPDLMAKIEKHLGKGTVTEKRLKELAKANKAVVAAGYQQMEDDFTESLKDIGVTEAEWNAAMLAKTVPIAIDFRTPHLGVLKGAIAKTPVHGKLLKDWFKSTGEQTSARVMQQVNIGMAQGESIDKIVRRIKGTQAAKYSDGILQESRRNIAAIVRTAIAQTANFSREEVYKANADVIKGVQMVATLDSRTTDICMAIDGKVFGVGEGPRPPFHWQCRTMTVPVLRSWKELGINLKEAPVGTRASMNEQVPAKTTYPAWLKTQSVEVQNDALGPVRARLFRQGKVKIDRFVKDGRTLTLRELRKREGLSVSDIAVKVAKKKAS